MDDLTWTGGSRGSLLNLAYVRSAQLANGGRVIELPSGRFTARSAPSSSVDLGEYDTVEHAIGAVEAYGTNHDHDALEAYQGGLPR